MNERTPVLDHGYVQLIEAWGSDERIVEAARMSTAKGFLGWTFEDGTERDMKLLRYLYEHKHLTPFEMCGMTIEVQAPIMVFREWHRHRTQSYNEMSARYVPLPDVNYVPTVERLMMTSDKNKQAKGIDGRTLTAGYAEVIRQNLMASYLAAEQIYRHALDVGVPKELARLCIPVGRYSRMRASANLRCWMMFLTLRLDETAQWEIRQFAEAVATILRENFPRTMGLFDEKR